MRNFKEYFLQLKLKDYKLLVCLIFLFGCHLNQIQAQNKFFTIVLDAGHGGHDPGNLGTKRYSKSEKDVALDITLKVGKILSDNVKDIKVLYTRTTDVYPDLWQRAKIANEANADFFISIHCNSFKNNASGTETFVLGVHRNSTNMEVAKRENDVILLEKDHEKHYQYDPNSPESIIGLTLMQEEYLDKSIELAQLVESSFVNKAKRTSRGVKQAGLIVLHQTYMPSVLIEVGFLSNKKEEDFLNTNSGQLKIANAIVDAIKKFKLHAKQNEVDIDAVTSVIKEDKKPENIKAKTDNDIFYKVQLAAGANKIATKPYNFKGLRNVVRVKIGRFYKYYIGNSHDYKEIDNLKKMAQAKGFKSAFIVAFKNNQQIDIETNLKSN